MKKKWLRDLTVILLITLGMLLSLEGSMRFAGYTPAPPLMSEWMQPDPVLLWTNKPNSHGKRGSRFTPTISYLHNAQGFRMRENIQPKPIHAFRVIMMGDSNIWGFGLERSQTAAAILNDSLHKQIDASNHIEVLNLGVTGYSSYQGMKLLERSLVFEPDLIIFGYGYNDRRYVASNHYDRESYFQKTYRGVLFQQWLYSYSALSSWFRDANQQNQQVILKELVPRVSPDSYRKNFEAMLNLCAINNIPAIVLGLRDNPAIASRVNQARQYKIEGYPGLAALDYFRILNAPNITESSLVPYLLLDLVQTHPDEVIESVQEHTEMKVTAQRLRSDLEHTFLPVESLMGMTVIREDWEYLAVLEEVCSNYTDTIFLDYQEVTSDLSDEEILSCYFPTDPCHMTVTGQTRLAQYLEPLILNQYRESRESL